ncbi:MAG TPA: hypothetical protein VG935_01620 [Patescibacteria group bacterium]|nr:hypothetical protein [Patescibacteria group bacterium]
MQDLQLVTRQLEYLFLKKLVDEVRSKTLDNASAKQLATAFLQIEPFASVEDAKSKIEQFTRYNAQFATLNEYIDAYFSEQHKDILIEKMRQHIKAGNIDQAIQIAKQ